MPLATLAAAALGSKTAFNYNRENFLYDRRLRMLKEFQEMKFRIIQGDLWRQDVRDIIGLVETKARKYLLVNVMMMGICVSLWVQGAMPESVPDWLMLGNQVAIGGAFAFIVLTIWLAMHASVSAAGFKARLLTQMVRLPIPSWEEMEAARTYASSFEKVEGRQMFRIPFVMGSQQNLVPDAGPPPVVLFTYTKADHAKKALFDRLQEEFKEHTLNADNWKSHIIVQDAAGRVIDHEDVERGQLHYDQWDITVLLGNFCEGAPTDPWGFEFNREDKEMSELGCPVGAACAHKAHIKLVRQAAQYWQSYDAFARISMSIAANQLTLAMGYYILGYVLVQASSPWPAFAGVTAMIGMAFAILTLDLNWKFENTKARVLTLLTIAGPAFTCAACFHHHFGTAGEEVSRSLAPAAFICHAILVICLLYLSQLQDARGGGQVPRGFKHVLYLDTFAGSDAWDSCDIGEASTEDMEKNAYCSAYEMEKEVEKCISTGLDSDLLTNLVQPVIEDEEVTFRPGQVGIEYKPGPFHVDKVEKGSQADLAGVKVGWIIRKIDGEMPSAESLPERAHGDRNYIVTFGRPKAVGSSRGQNVQNYVMHYLEEGATNPEMEHSLPLVEQDAARMDSMRCRGGAAQRWMDAEVSHLAPSLQSIAYDKKTGHAHQSSIQSHRPHSVHQDLRHLAGAPKRGENQSEVNYDRAPMDFYEATSFYPQEARGKQTKEGQAPSFGGHDHEIPGRVPWAVFLFCTILLGSVWTVAAIYSFLDANGMTAYFNDFSIETTEARGVGRTPKHHGLKLRSGLNLKVRGLLQTWSSSEERGKVLDVSLPFSHMNLQGLSCDAAGKHFAMTDGISTFVGEVSARATQKRSLRAGSQLQVLQFQEVARCPSLLGKSLKDTAIACSHESDKKAACEVLFLSSRGEEVASCPVGKDAAKVGLGKVASLSQRWLHKGRNRERPAWLLLDAECSGKRESASTMACTSVRTTHGRHAHLQHAASQDQASLAEDLFPDEVLPTTESKLIQENEEETLSQGMVRTLNRRYVGVLDREGKSIQLLDKQNNLASAGILPLPTKGTTEAFCAGGGHLYVLQRGRSLQMLQIALPEELL